jgi:hypothetical protein
MLAASPQIRKYKERNSSFLSPLMASKLHLTKCRSEYARVVAGKIEKGEGIIYLLHAG